MRIWLNGEIMDEAEARISPFDRGFLFGDGVYEGIRFFNRVGVGMDLHVERMRRSLAAAGIENANAEDLHEICGALLKDGDLEDAMIYIQYTRGVQIPRSHRPEVGLTPTVFAYAAPAPALSELGEPQVRRCITVEDIRWRRCEIKCTSLMANVLAIKDAREQDIDEPIFQRNGMVGEGAMTNVFAVIGDTLVTPLTDDDPPILHGVTRQMILDVATEVVSHVEERPVSVDELREAGEVMITSSRRMLDSVGEVDGLVIADGGVGPVARTLLTRLQSMLGEVCGVALHSA
jgi:D-alanine transaminase